MDVGVAQIFVIAAIGFIGVAVTIYLIKKPDTPVWKPEQESQPIQDDEPEKELNSHLQEWLLNEKRTRLPTTLNVVAIIATACSFILFLGSYPMQWFGKGPLQSTLWSAGLVLTPVSAIFFLVSIWVGVMRGARAHACALGISIFLFIASIIGWFAVLSWLCNFE